MKIQRPTDFLMFKDGILSIYAVKGNKLDLPIYSTAFDDRVVGMKRYFTARTATVNIDRIVHIPQNRSITSLHRAVINGTAYKIEQIQHIDDSNPRCTVLTLSQIGARSPDAAGAVS